MSNKNFHGQVAIVTGAGQGIGLEIAKQLSANGASVILNDIDEHCAKQAAAEIEAAGGICHPMAGSAGDVPFIQKMVDEAVSRFGSLTIAIANAGITIHGDFFDYKPESLQTMFNVNVNGTFFLAQAAARQMKKQGSGGSLVFMSSVNGHQANKHLAGYAMTKAGIEMLAKNLVIELSPYNISVNAVAPGATVTPRTMLEQDDFAGVWGKITPMGKTSTVGDIANAILFFASPASRQITGQYLVVDGGWTSVSPSPNMEL
jgi:NAD(P)-dependent dehydrogenase (short-subunit alcohol dehydrogenase family)